GSAPNCLVKVTPIAQLNGHATITLIVSDGNASAESSFTLSVLALPHDGDISAGILSNVDWNTDHLAIKQWTVTDRQLKSNDPQFDMLNLVGLWHLDETAEDSVSGNDFADASANNIYGNLFGAG